MVYAVLGCTGSSLLSLVVVSRGHSLVVVLGLLIAVASLVSAPELQGAGPVVAEHRLSCSAGSSWTRDGTHVPYTGRWILNQC